MPAEDGVGAMLSRQLRASRMSGVGGARSYARGYRQAPRDFAPSTSW